MRPFAAAIAALCVTGCATVALQELDQRYGKPDPTRYDVAAKPEAGISYRKDVQPIVERRCVVCHACYDGPCQLKLTAWKGIARGTSKAAVYDAARVRESPTTRLFLDAQLPSQWWELGFSPVLNNRAATPETNLAASVLYRSLQLKREHPLPATPVLSKAFDFSLDRKATCPRVDEFENYAANQPLAGMPYGLPGLDEREFATIQRWIAAGAPYEGDLPLSPAVQEQIRTWETFLNGESDKERLMSRYLYEHLYLGTLPTDLPALAKAIGSMASENDYRKLADRYAVRRTNPRFWVTSDELIDAYAAWAPVEAGIFDYSRLENR